MRPKLYDMPLPGGPSDKFGALYESRRTVAAMLDVLEEKAESIRLEPPGDEGEGVEFWLRSHDSVEFRLRGKSVPRAVGPSQI